MNARYRKSPGSDERDMNFDELVTHKVEQELRKSDFGPELNKLKENVLIFLGVLFLLGSLMEGEFVCAIVNIIIVIIGIAMKIERQGKVQEVESKWKDLIRKRKYRRINSAIYRFSTTYGKTDLKTTFYSYTNTISKRQPTQIFQHKDKKWYLYKDEFWLTNEDYSEKDLLYLIEEQKEKKKKKVEKAKKFVTKTPSNEGRERIISQDVKDRVWNRDNGKCVECGSNENLEFDHIIPFSKGGANTYRNIQLLCENCNRSKSDNIG